MRIVITGPPQSGKTTLAIALQKILGPYNFPVYHTDEFKDHDWSRASEVASQLFDNPDPWIIEGTTVPRALRKWLVTRAQVDPPFDKFILIRNPKVVLQLQGQQTMAKTVVGLAEMYKNWIGDRWIEL